MDVYATVVRCLAEAGPPDDDAHLWAHLDELADPAEARPKLAPDIELKRFSLRWGNDYAMICNPRDLVHYRLEPVEADLVELMDGSHTVGDIVVRRMEESGDLELSAAVELVEALDAGNFFDRPFVDTEAALERALQPPPNLFRRLHRLLTTLQVEWSNAEAVIRWLYDHGVKWFYRRWMVAAMAPVIVGGFLAFLYVVDSRRFTIGGRSPALASIVLLALSFLLTFVHELGHGATLVHFGRRVKSAGIMIYFGSPAFFIESSDGLMMDRGERMLQSLAGPYAELIVSGLGSLWVVAFPGSAVAPLLYKFAVLNYFVVFMNLIPLLELDGYWFFSDLIQVPDLRPRSIAFLRHGLWEKLRRRSRLSLQELGLGVYATIGVVFGIFALYTAFFFWRALFGGLVTTLWNDDLLTRILLLALILVVAGPVIRAAIDGVRAIGGQVRALWRRAVFRVQRGWRVEAVRLIDASPLFEDVPEDVLGELAGLAKLKTASRGQPVFCQGDRPDGFFVVRKGSMEVVEELPDGGERVLQTLARGDTFGELGLVEGTPRTATVRAAVRSELFAFDKGAFDAFMADAISVPSFAPTLQAVTELAGLPCFASLGAEQLGELLEAGAWVGVSPGTTIIREGEVGDAFYAIGSGQVDVTKDGAPIRALGAGAFVGEVALLFDVPRTSTVTARTPVRAFRLERAGFDRVLRRAFRRGELKPHVPAGRTWQH